MSDNNKLTQEQVEVINQLSTLLPGLQNLSIQSQQSNQDSTIMQSIYQQVLPQNQSNFAGYNPTILSNIKTPSEIKSNEQSLPDNILHDIPKPFTFMQNSNVLVWKTQCLIYFNLRGVTQPELQFMLSQYYIDPSIAKSIYFQQISTFEQLCTYLQQQYGKTSQENLTTLLQAKKQNNQSYVQFMEYLKNLGQYGNIDSQVIASSFIEKLPINVKSFLNTQLLFIDIKNLDRLSEHVEQIAKFLNSQSHNSKPHEQKLQSSIQCNYCKQFGHYKSECPILKDKNKVNDNTNKLSNFGEVINDAYAAEKRKNDNLISVPVQQLAKKPKQFEQQQQQQQNNYQRTRFTQDLSFMDRMKNITIPVKFFDYCNTRPQEKQKLLSALNQYAHFGNSEKISVQKQTIPIYISVKINDIPCQALLDTGSDSSYISKDFAYQNELLINSDLATSLTGISGFKYNTIGGIENCNILLGDMATFECVTLQVVNNSNFEVLLGRDILHNLNLQIFDQYTQITLPQSQQAHANITENFNLDMMQSIRHLFFTYQESFSKHEFDLGFTNIIEHHIRLKENYTPKKRNYFRTSLKQRMFLRQTLDQFLRQGFIRPSESEWASPVVLIKKGDTFRFCCGFEELNEVTLRFQQPIPLIDDILFRLHSKKVFSKLDARQSFFQLPMSPNDIHKTAFICEFGLFEWVRMPQGLRNASATFQSLVNKLFQQYIGTFIFCYIDDILIFSDTIQDHFEHLSIVFDTLKNANIKLNLNKCQFFQNKLLILGHQISDGLIKPNPEKVQTIQKILPPISLKQTQQFLGLVGYYKKFIKNYATHAKPLFNLLRQNQKFFWSIECQSAFDYLKNKLIEEPILRLPNLEKQFIVHTDFSCYAISAILSQLDENNHEYVVYYTSRVLNEYEQNYSSFEGELLAIVYAIEKFHHFIADNEFTLVTDNQALYWIFNNDLFTYYKQLDLNKKLFRWISKIKSYDFKIQHKKGSQHTNADALSRLQIDTSYFVQTQQNQNSDVLPSPCAICEQNLESNYICCDYCNTGFHQHCAQIQSMPLGFYYCYHCTQKILSNDLSTLDVTMDLIFLDFLINNVTPLEKSEQLRVQARSKNYIFENNTLYYKKDNKKLIVPSYADRKNILDYTHAEKLSHSGINRTFYYLREIYYWRQMFQDIQTFIRNCIQCQIENAKYYENDSYTPTFKGVQPFQIWALDLITNLSDQDKHTLALPETKSNNKHIIVATCMFSKWVEAAPICNKSSETIGNWFNSTILCRYGTPQRVHLDNGLEFSGYFKKLCIYNNIKMDFCYSYYPRGNGLAERMNQTLIKALRKCVATNPTTWDNLLPNILHSLRISQSKATKFPPYNIVFGRQCPHSHTQYDIQDSNDQDLQNFIDHLYQIQCTMDRNIKFNITKTDNNNKITYELSERTHQPVIFEINDLVMLKRPRSKKLEQNVFGPYKIIKFLDDEQNFVQLQLLSTKNITTTSISNLLKINKQH